MKMLDIKDARNNRRLKVADNVGLACPLRVIHTLSYCPLL